MADLSGVLRKTIDGLPRATPQMRAKVYDKARAAIQRQIQAANPPIAPEVAEARMNALEDAIERTEAHYVELESGASSETDAAPEAAPPEPQTQPIAPETAPPVAAERPSPSDSAPPAPAREPDPEPYAPEASRAGPAMHSAWGAAPDPEPDDEPAYARPAGDEPMADRPGDGWGASRGATWDDESQSRESAAAGPGWGADTQGSRGASEPPVFRPAEPDETSHAPVGVSGPFVPSGAAAGAAMADYGHDDRRTDEREFDRDETSPDLEHQGHDDADRHAPIPAADISAPRYAPPRGAAGRRKGSGAAVGIVSLIVVVGGLGAAAWFYGDEIASLVTGEPVVATNDGAAAPAETDGSEATTGEGETDVAGVASGEAAGTRQYTQRLLPDGTEVDEGPATPEPNAFGEGTNVAAANAVEPDANDGTSPTIAAEIGENPEIVGAGEEPSAGETPSEAGAETAAAPEASENGAIPVAQRTVFYQERTADSPGTQETGNVVWSVVEEPPIEGQPPEPAIRAVAEVPDENLTMTMTIRRNADPTLPASHVIELLFDTPSGFPGGSVATVQRLALKPTEQARGEPLIGVAGKISDGFFIIALNNLDQAVQNNLSLLESEQWIDIPIAYATGRRALVSIEKGIPGDRAFKEAIAAWDAKT
ncbi:MAG: hypothetical protein VYD57_18155 [Pseudomonadota bacterium]|nr:hypothetical protein [Pseudomonadota bacterium]